jgi:hypothetical protein
MSAAKPTDQPALAPPEHNPARLQLRGKGWVTIGGQRFYMAEFGAASAAEQSDEEKPTPTKGTA